MDKTIGQRVAAIRGTLSQVDFAARLGVLTGQGDMLARPAVAEDNASDIKERMEGLLRGLAGDEEDGLVSEWIELGATLSIAQLLLLLKIAVQGDEWMLEPIQFQLSMNPIDPNSPPTPIWHAAFLPQWKLKLLAGQAQLEELGLIRIEDDGDGCMFKLTPRGAHAVNWWVGVLAELGLTHDELKAI